MEYISRDYSQKVDAVQYTDKESLKKIKQMIGRGYRVKEKEGELFIGEYKVEVGQFIVLTMTALIVKDHAVFGQRFKPIQTQGALFKNE